MTTRDKPTGRSLAALRIGRWDEWSAIVSEAVKRHDLRLQFAAKELKVCHRTMQRWARELRLPSAPRGKHIEKKRRHEP